MEKKIKIRNYSHSFHMFGNSGKWWFFSNWKKIAAFVSIVALVVVTGGIYPPTHKAEAAGLDVITTTLSATGAGAESKISVVFTPGAHLTDNETILVYIGENSGGDPWVDTDVTIDSTDVICSQGATNWDGYVQTDATATTPVTFGCTVNGAGEAGAVTITLGDGAGDDMYNPAGADIYNVAVVTTDDSGAGVAYVGDANKVDVSVTVLSNLSMILDNADGTYCTGSPVVTCNLGTVLTTTVVTGSYDINLGTNAANGATVQIAENQDLGTIDDFVEDSGAIAAGTEEYGVSVSEDGAWTFAGNYTDNDTPIAAGPTNLATTAAAIAETGDDITVTHKAAIDSTTASGSHSHTVTYTASADF